MKKIYTFISAIIISFATFGQCSVAVTGSTNVSCFGGCNGSVTLTTLGTPTFSYVWSPGGQTVQNPTNLCAGVNTVTMTDASACVATASVTITQPALLQDSTIIVNATCNGDCDASIDLVPYGGTSPYTYAWLPNGETTQDISSLCAGSYSVTITDANSCTTSDNVIVTEPAVLAVGVTPNNGCGSSCDKSGIAAPTGGTAPYSYLWSPGGQTTQTATGLCAGTFLVDVTDDNGCTAAGVVTISNPTALSVSTSSTDATCGTCPDGSTTATPSGGTSPYTYSWSPGGCTSANCTGLTPGVYTVTITDANGCTQTAADTVGNSVGINTVFSDNKIAFYPNPATSQVTIDFNAEKSSLIQLSIVNLIGEKIYTESINENAKSKTISLQSFASGVYFLNVEIDGQKISHKLIKK